MLSNYYQSKYSLIYIDWGRTMSWHAEYVRILLFDTSEDSYNIKLWVTAIGQLTAS